MTVRVDHRHLLADKEIRTWYDENSLRSKLTAEVNLRQLGLFCHDVGLAPNELAGLARSDLERLHGVLVRYAKTLQGSGHLPSYIAKTFVGVKGWLRLNRIEFNHSARLRVAQGESLRDERVPTQEELRRVLSTYTARSRVVALFMAHAGSGLASSLRLTAATGYGSVTSRISNSRRVSLLNASLSMSSSRPDFQRPQSRTTRLGPRNSLTRSWLTSPSDESGESS